MTPEGSRTLGRDAKVGADDELGVGGLRGVVGGAEHRQAHRRRRPPAQRRRCRWQTAQERRFRLRLSVPRSSGPKRGGPGTGSRDATAWKTRTAEQHAAKPGDQRREQQMRRQRYRLTCVDRPARSVEGPGAKATASATAAAASSAKSSRQAPPRGYRSHLPSPRRSWLISRLSDRRPGMYSASAVVEHPRPRPRSVRTPRDPSRRPRTAWSGPGSPSPTGSRARPRAKSRCRRTTSVL